MDNFTESFNPYYKYENFECYVKLNMEYLKTTDGYKFYKIDDGLTNILLNKSLLDDEKYKEYADLLSKYEADFTYDCEEPIEGYDDITGKFGKVCRVAFYPKKGLTLSYKNVLRLREFLDDANEYIYQKKTLYAGRKDLEAKAEKELEEVNQHIGLLDDYIWEMRNEKN